ncbi:hypothetical protein [Spirochaeta lutea]|uniref:Uncharacterized protein n=1 Tax=Spirochaeta lutea TaxID=1480694 RepID=A0A098QVF8_9SPIO|nr:hypothetical protein [Spirochaeta lutea]KGE71363.1 hypothetical protein DC28_11175 [Spirochaeta lutea]
MILQFWSTPLRPDLILRVLPEITSPGFLEEGESLLVDFGALFPWGFESRINDYLVYPEDFFPPFRALMDSLLDRWGFYLPTIPQPWRGDVACYDSLADSRGAFTRLVEEFRGDVESLLPGVPLDQEALEQAQVISSLALAAPEDYQRFTRIDERQGRLYTEICQEIQQIGMVLNGPLRGYQELHTLQARVEHLLRDADDMNTTWQDFLAGTQGLWFGDAADLILESRAFPLRRITDTLVRSFEEYERFRRFSRR